MSNLGKPRPHTAREIRERREKVLILLSKGMNQTDIAYELKTTRQTIMKDISELNQWTRKGLYDMAKQSLSTMLYSCLIGLNEAEKEAWRLYNNENNDPEFSNWHKVAALRLLIDINKSKFRMFSDGPAFMEIGRLQTELGRIKETYLLGGKDNSFKPFVKPSSSELSNNIVDKDTLVNRDGIPYRIERFHANKADSSQELEKEEEEETEDSESDLDSKQDHE